MAQIPTTRSVRLFPIAEGLQEIGHSISGELRRASLPARSLESPLELIPIYRFWDLAKAVSRATGWLALTAHTIERTGFENLLISPMVLGSPTLARLLESMCAYSTREARHARFWLLPVGNDVWFRYAIHDADEQRGNVFLEIGALAWMQKLVRVVQPRWRPRQIFVNRPEFGDLGRQLMDSGWPDIRFGAGLNGFPIPREMLTWPLPDAPRHSSTAPGSGPALSHPETMSQTVAALIRSYQHDEWLSCEQVAELAEVSLRTLQLELASEGVTFRQILERCRMETALSRLRVSDCSIKQIATDLGYADPSAFVRAFRRWTGVRPTDMRTAAGTEMSTQDPQSVVSAAWQRVAAKNSRNTDR